MADALKEPELVVVVVQLVDLVGSVDYSELEMASAVVVDFVLLVQNALELVAAHVDDFDLVAVDLAVPHCFYNFVVHLCVVN